MQTVPGVDDSSVVMRPHLNQLVTFAAARHVRVYGAGDGAATITLGEQSFQPIPNTNLMLMEENILDWYSLTTREH